VICSVEILRVRELGLNLQLLYSGNVVKAVKLAIYVYVLLECVVCLICCFSEWPCLCRGIVE
jgi:hypothetical protein